MLLQTAQMHQLLQGRLMAAALHLQPASPLPQVRGLGMDGVDHSGPGVGVHLGFPLEKNDQPTEEREASMHLSR